MMNISVFFFFHFLSDSPFLFQINVIDAGLPKFFLDASLELDLGDGFLVIGENLNDDDNGVEGGKLLSWRHLLLFDQLLLMAVCFLASISAAQFLTDHAKPIKLLVEIQAAFATPILRSHGEVTIQVNDEGALVEGKVKFLAMLNPTVKIQWDWAFNDFHAEFGNITFTPGVLEMNGLVLDVETQPSLELFFDVDITVLSFADLGATLFMVRFAISFMFELASSITHQLFVFCNLAGMEKQRTRFVCRLHTCG